MPEAASNTAPRLDAAERRGIASLMLIRTLPA